MSKTKNLLYILYDNDIIKPNIYYVIQEYDSITKNLSTKIQIQLQVFSYNDTKLFSYIEKNNPTTALTKG